MKLVSGMPVRVHGKVATYLGHQGTVAVVIPWAEHDPMQVNVADLEVGADLVRELVTRLVDEGYVTWTCTGCGVMLNRVVCEDCHYAGVAHGGSP